MCFSARVQQNLRALSKQYGAEISWELFEDLFRRRLEGEDIKLARSLERNFDDPANDVERRAHASIDQFRSWRVTQWEKDIFAQRKRLADAERSLLTRQTKRAHEDVRIATQKIQDLMERLSDVRRVVPDQEDERIFPLSYCPVLVEEGGRRFVRPMRYTCRLAGKTADVDQRFPGTYNARRDNLSGYWNTVYGNRHAVMVMFGFFENVPRHVYEHRELRTYEKQENLVLQFDPRPPAQMLVACVWDHWSGRGARDLDSFAAITDDPPAEIAATGHQRCVVVLREQNLTEWLSPATVSRERLDAILGERETPHYEHRIAA